MNKELTIIFFSLEINLDVDCGYMSGRKVPLALVEVKTAICLQLHTGNWRNPFNKLKTMFNKFNYNASKPSSDIARFIIP